MALVRARDLGVTHSSATGPVTALSSVSFDAEPGEIVIVTGPSGSGKTTLLSCLGGALTPTVGTVEVDGMEVGSLSGPELAEFRRRCVGFIFQDFRLIDCLNALENVEIPLRASGVPRREARRRAAEALDGLGLGDRQRHHPGQLSGGQRQRVAIARATVGGAPMIIADEPTANLDVASAESVIELLRREVAVDRVVVLATHDVRLHVIADRLVELVPSAAGADRSGTIELSRDDVLFAEGDPSDVVFVVEAGAIELWRIGPEGVREVLRRCGPGEYFGELGPMLGFPRSTTATAAEASRVRGVPMAEFRRTVAAGPAVAPTPSRPIPRTRRRRRPLRREDAP